MRTHLTHWLLAILLALPGIALAQPSNDECANALPLTVGGLNDCSNALAVDLATATDSPNDPSCDVTATNYDVWFSFQAPATGSVLITITGGTSVEGAIFSDCTQRDEFFCSSTATGKTVGGLVPGDTYILNIWKDLNTSGTAFTVCLSTPPPGPANDLCANAAVLPVSTSSACGNAAMGTTSGATITAGGTCTGTTPDVWYTFTPTTTGGYALNVTEIFETGTGTTYVALYSGACGGLTQIGTSCTSTSLQALLTANVTYYVSVRYTATNGTYVDFSLCGYELPAGPANDACTSPSVLPLSSSSACATPAMGTTQSAVPSSVGACSSTTPDVWYTFTPPTSGGYAITVTSTFNSSTGVTYATLYSGTCGALTQFGTSCTTTTVSAALTGGETYYVNVRYTLTTGAYSNFNLCAYALPAPPANDICANAAVLPVSTSSACANAVAGTTQNALATQSGVCSTTTPDVYYAFTPTSSGVHVFTVAETFDSGTGSTYVALYSGSCGALTQIGTSCSSTTLSAALTAGVTYYVTVRYTLTTGAYANFTLCGYELPPPPANDVCSSAAVLPVSADASCTSAVAGTTQGATLTASGVCNTTTPDVYYTFTPASTGVHVFTVAETFDSGAGSTYVAIYSGSCGTLTQIGTSCTSTTLSAALTAGVTYYVTVRYSLTTGAYANFTLCGYALPPPPANDDCTTAAVLPVSADATCASAAMGTTQGATATTAGACNLTTPDVWYTFTPTVSGGHVFNVSETFDSGTGSTYVVVYSGSCGGLTQIGTSCTTTSLLASLTAGQTYYVNVRYSATTGTYSNFAVCGYALPPPPANDICSQPGTLTESADQTCANAVAGTLAGATAAATPGACSTTTPDVWYTFTPSTSTTYVITATETFDSGTGATYVRVYSGSCAGLTPLGTSCSLASQTEALVAGTTYYVSVRYSATNGTYSDFSLCAYPLPPPPSNDDCANAATLPVSADPGCSGAIAGTTAAATASSSGACNSTTPDVWYTLTAPTTGRYVLNVAETFDSGSGSTYVAIYAGTCGGLTQIGTTVSCTSLSLQADLDANVTYYVTVRYTATTGSFSNFTLCAYALPPPPVNDECSGAQMISVGLSSSECATVSGNNISATNSTPVFGADPVCASNTYGGGDLWYAFTAPSASVTFDFSVESFSTTVLVFYPAGCGTTTSVTCGSRAGTGPIAVAGFTPGESYVMRIYDFGGNDFGPFAFCAYATTPPAVASSAGCSPTVTALVDGSGTPARVHFVNSSGIIASIDNTRPLGLVQVNLFDGAGVRQTSNGAWYLGRNITIVPATQPGGPIGVTLYATAAEVDALIMSDPNAMTIGDFSVRRVPSTVCSSTFPGGGVSLGQSPASFGTNFALTTSVSSFSEFFVFGSAAPLPVELTRLTAEAAGSRNVVRWAAASEVAFSHYVLERAVRDDLTDFAPVTEVAARGAASGAEAVYEAYDAAPAAVTYYRLRAVDRDGSAEYSDVVAVRRTDVAGGGGVKVWPNPAAAGGAVSIGLPAGLEEADVFVHDAAGRQVARLQATGTQVDLPLGGLPAGVYAVTARGATASQTVRLVIE